MDNIPDTIKVFKQEELSNLQKVGANNRQLVVKQYRDKVMFDSYEDIYGK